MKKIISTKSLFLQDPKTAIIRGVPYDVAALEKKHVKYLLDNGLAIEFDAQEPEPAKPSKKK